MSDSGSRATNDLDLSDLKTGIESELPNSFRCVAELTKLKKEFSDKFGPQIDFFDFGVDLNLDSKGTLEGKLDVLTRACIWHAIALKAEINLKLLHTIDGYLAAVDTKNPISTFLLARYLLELVATVSQIDFDLQACAKISVDEWPRRGMEFLGILYRARHSTTDESYKSVFQKLGVPRHHYEPIRIKNAIKSLVARPGFSSAKKTYDSLSNMCHHNGSAHKMLASNPRETKSIVSSGGTVFSLNEKAAAFSLQYQDAYAADHALARTARVAWWSAFSADRIAREIREVPFTQKELRSLTKGRLLSARPVDAVSEKVLSERWIGRQVKLGRNEPCACGSGEKFKNCCWGKRVEYL